MEFWSVFHYDVLMASHAKLARSFAFLGIALAMLSASLLHADDKASIAVGKAKTKKTVVAIPEPKGDKSLAKSLRETVDTDLKFMDLFRILEPAAFVEPASAGIAPGSFKISDWKSIGSEFVVKSALSKEGDALSLEAYVYETGEGKAILSKRYKTGAKEIQLLAHTFANDIVEALTGQPGIFLTKIAMVCDRGGKTKEVFMMDFDGTNVKQLTQHRSTIVTPAWSPDGTKIAYSLFTKRKDNVKNIDLYEFDFKTSSIRMLSNRKGINSGATYSPDGKSIAMTMSFLGNPEIFLFDPGKKTATRLTKSFGVDVDPAFSPDGKSIAFVSSRSGMPMVFSMALDGSKIQRLTYAGKYNASPGWSPNGKKLVFAGWIDKKFDIFTMNVDGTNIERLTKDQGSNEDPSFSPDGNFIVFSSDRTGQRSIYVMNVDGTYVKRLTFGLGNCNSPRWSNPPK